MPAVTVVSLLCACVRRGEGCWGIPVGRHTHSLGYDDDMLGKVTNEILDASYNISKMKYILNPT